MEVVIVVRSRDAGLLLRLQSHAHRTDFCSTILMTHCDIAPLLLGVTFDIGYRRYCQTSITCICISPDGCSPTAGILHRPLPA